MLSGPHSDLKEWTRCSSTPLETLLSPTMELRFSKRLMFSTLQPRWLSRSLRHRIPSAEPEPQHLSSSPELLKQSEELIDANVHPTVITNGYKMAAAKAIEVLDKIAVDAKNDKILKQVATTALTGKSVGDEEDHLSDLVVQAAKTVAEKGVVGPKNIRIQKKVGGTIADTEIISGLVIDKERLHTRMPEKVTKAKIALFSCPLEVKKTEFDAAIQITDPSMMSSFLTEEENTMKAMVEAIKKAGANVVYCSKGIDELVQHYLAKAGILAYRRCKASDLDAIALATGGTVCGNVMEITSKDLGTAGEVEERRVGEDGMSFITGCKNAKAVTIFVRGGTEHVLEEVETRTSSYH